MVCKGCGAEIAKGAKVCGGCGKAAAKSSFSSRIIEAIVVFTVVVLIIWILLPGYLPAKNRDKYTGCLQSMQSISKGLNIYMEEKGDFNTLTQSGGNGDEICDNITMADKTTDCVGKVPERMSQNCLAYSVDVNKPAPFQYEITSHSNEKTKCGICVTEAGYCPTRYTGMEPANSRCKKSCKDAGVNSTAVCPH